jgi:hypothetical protein
MSIKNPKDLVGGTYSFRDIDSLSVLNTYMLDGRIVVETSVKKIYIDKSEWSTVGQEFKAQKMSSSRPTLAPTTSSNNNPISASTNDKVAGTYYMTNKYWKFTFNPKNRSIDKLHVKQLASSIKKRNLLCEQPILVNEKYEVIDGQHRLSAAMKLTVPIFYIIRAGLTIEDAIALNINTKNWGLGDYLQHYATQKVAEYLYFERFIDEYKLGFSISITLLMGGGIPNAGGSNYNKEFKAGKLSLNFQEYAEKIGKLCQQLKEYGTFSTERSFVIALVQGMDFAQLEPSVLLEKVAAAPDKFTKCSDSEAYTRMLEDVINYRTRNRIRLY